MLVHNRGDSHPDDIIRPTVAVLAFVQSALNALPPNRELQLGDDAIWGLTVLLRSVSETFEYLSAHTVWRSPAGEKEKGGVPC
jgi:hypothetical protein